MGAKRWGRGGALRVPLVLLATAVALAGALADRAAAQIATDGSVGPAVDLVGPDYQIPASLGSQSGSTLFHSFSVFDVPAGGSATFTPVGLLGPVSHLVGRVTGGEPSRIAGRLASQVGEQHLILLNPAGIAFVEGSSVDVPGSLHVTTADRVGFEDGRFFSASDPGGSPLSIAAPVSFGFLDGPIPAPIDIEGFVEVGVGDSIRLVGGDLTIRAPTSPFVDGVVSAVDGDVLLVAVGSGGEVRGVLGPAGDVVLSGFASLADVAVEGGAIVSSSGISPIFGTPVVVGGAVPPAQLDAPFVRVDGVHDRLATVAINLPSPEPQDVLLGTDSAGRTLHLRPLDRGAEGAGQIRVVAHDLDVVDSSLRAATAGDGASGGISIRLSGDLSIERRDAPGDVGLFTNAGVLVRGDQTVLVFSGGSIEELHFEDVDLVLGGSGDGGDISIEAGNVAVEGGARISASSLSAGRGGDVTLAVRDAVHVSGGEPGARSTIFSNAGGSGDGGVIRIQDAALLQLSDGGRLIAATSGDANAGDIAIDVGRLEILGASQIDNSSSGAAAGAAGTTAGNGGNIDIRASGSVRIVGIPGDESSAQVSTLAQVRTSGDAGRIDIRTPSLEVRDSGNVSVTTDGAGDGGDIAIDADQLLLSNGAFISAASTGRAADLGEAPGAAGSILLGASGPDAGSRLRNLTLERARVTTFAAEGPPPPPDPADADALREGNIEVRSSGLVQLTDGSELEASVGEGLGGRVTLQAGSGLVLRDASSVLARAVGNGQGGRIEIRAGALFVSPDSRVSADAGVGVDGEVLIDSPETSTEDELASLDVDFGDASALVRPACAARAAGIGGSLTVQQDAGAARRPEGLLWASDLLPGVRADPQLDDALARGDLAAARARLSRRRDEDASPRAALGVAHDLANLTLLGGDATRAYQDLLAVAASARRAGDPEIERAAHASAAQLDLRAGRLGDARARLEAAAPGERLASDLEAHVALLRAAGWRRLAAAEDARRDSDLLAAHAALLAAVRRASERGDDALLARALGELGELYAGEGRHDEALDALARAIAIARRDGAPEEVSRWYAAQASALWARGHAARALDAHRKALEALEQARQQSAGRYGALGSSFRARNEPLYLAYVDALLQSAGRVTDAATREGLLLEARRSMERLRAAELRDHFRDECIASLESLSVDLDAVLARSGSRAAVIYPIPLADRLELLVTLPSGIRRYTSAVGSARFEQVAGYFSRRVRSGSLAYRGPAAALFEWLVAPLEADLEADRIDTLVFVPGGGLSALPFAALLDGDRFLVERFAVAVAPGLSLVDPAPLDPRSQRFLLAGVSEAEGGFAALPHVRSELLRLRHSYGGTLLLDHAFQREPFERSLAADPPGVVHIASHAVFGGDPSGSYILTHGGRLTLDELAASLRRTQYREQPVQLLVLSACETAAGDASAALGLAGIAIRSGVRSALGSLWSIEDEAASDLMVDFYAALEHPGVSKAEALRRAQLALLAREPYRHPQHWSAFVLLSNWL